MTKMEAFVEAADSWQYEFDTPEEAQEIISRFAKRNAALEHALYAHVSYIDANEGHETMTISCGTEKMARRVARVLKLHCGTAAARVKVEVGPGMLGER